MSVAKYSQIQNTETAEARATLLEEWCRDLTNQFLHERRVDLPRLERHATEALQRPTERFIGERQIARDVLDVDIPRKEKLIDAALLILQFANYRQRALFILGNWDRRASMIASVQSAGAVRSDTGRPVSL